MRTEPQAHGRSKNLRGWKQVLFDDGLLTAELARWRSMGELWREPAVYVGQTRSVTAQRKISSQNSNVPTRGTMGQEVLPRCPIG